MVGSRFLILQSLLAQGIASGMAREDPKCSALQSWEKDQVGHRKWLRAICAAVPESQHPKEHSGWGGVVGM